MILAEPFVLYKEGWTHAVHEEAGAGILGGELVTLGFVSEDPVPMTYEVDPYYDALHIELIVCVERALQPRALG